MVGGVLVNTTGLSTLKAKSRASLTGEGREIPISLEDTPDLKPIGGAYHLELEDLDKSIIVAHTAENEYVAVDIKCTHKGCDVVYSNESKLFVCPCHGSEFKTTGEVQKGPAKQALASYQTKYKNGEVIVMIPGDGAQSSAPQAAPKSDSTLVK